MKIVSVAAVFLLGGIFVPIFLVLLAVMFDSIVASALAVRWSWSHLHLPRFIHGVRHVGTR